MHDRTGAELKEYIDKIPKIELHVHLNGCVREDTLFELAKERNIKISKKHFTEIAGKDAHLYNTRPRSLVDCFDIFVQVGKVVRDLDALRRITRETLQDFASHHVAYLELRTTPKRLRKGIRDEGQIATKREYVEIIRSIFDKFEKEEKQRYQRECDQGEKNVRLPLVPRLLLSIDRSKSIEDAEENVDVAIDLHRSGDPYIVGVDLGGNPLKNDFRHFRDNLSRAREAGLKLSLHCGEIPCAEDYNETKSHNLKALEEAAALIDFHPDRLGHALLLPKVLQTKLAKLRIPVECCPTSNVMTLELAESFQGHLVEGLKSHPQLAGWLETDYPISISTDDPGVFNTNSSKELLLLAVAWNLSPEKIEKVVLRSIDHVFCDEDLKVLLRKNVQRFFQGVHYN